MSIPSRLTRGPRKPLAESKRVYRSDCRLFEWLNVEKIVNYIFCLLLIQSGFILNRKFPIRCQSGSGKSSRICESNTWYVRVVSLFIMWKHGRVWIGSEKKNKKYPAVLRVVLMFKNVCEIEIHSMAPHSSVPNSKRKINNNKYKCMCLTTMISLWCDDTQTTMAGNREQLENAYACP